MKKIIALALAAIMVFSMVACGGNKEDEISNATQYDVVKMADSYIAEMGLTEVTKIEDDYMEFMGISKDLYDEASGYYPQVSSSVDLVITIKAKDKNAVSEINGILEQRKNEIAATHENYNKNLMVKAQSGHTIVKDLYIMFAIGGDEVEFANLGADRAMEPVIEAMNNAFLAQEIATAYEMRHNIGEAPDVDNQI